MNKTVISVIMPVLNGERFLHESIESILSQSFGEFEFIIINDGSTDKTSEILHSYSDPRIVLIERENRGFAASLNEGLCLCKGKYIARSDADDVAIQNRFRSQYDFMEARNDVDILGGQALKINTQGQVIGRISKPTSWENIEQYLEYACPILHSSYFVRKNIYALTGGYRKMPPVEDYDFLLRASEEGCVMYNLSENIIKYREVSEGMCLSNPQKTVLFTHAVQTMHRLRVRGQKGEEKIMQFLAGYNKASTRWFKFVYVLRDKLLNSRKKQKGLKLYITKVFIALVSLLHYQIFRNTLNGIRSLRFNS